MEWSDIIFWFVIVAPYADRFLEEIPESVPFIGKFKGVLRPLIQAALRAIQGKKKNK